MKYSMLICSILLAATLPASAQSYDFGPLDRYLEDAARNLPTGFEVALVQNGQTLYWKQFGPWTKDRQASIASATKWFSGALIMSLVDDGTLSLDDRASKFLPYLTGEKAGITIRQLMSHTSGFPGEFPVADPCLSDSSDTLEHCAEALARIPLKAPAGTAFIYSGAGMQIAGRAAEVASGKDWQTLFRERITAPLGMTATDYEYEGPTRNPRISGGGRSTVSDYLTFLTMIEQRGVYNGRQILSTRAIDTMLSDQTAGAPIVESPFDRTAPENRYGIGNWIEHPDAAGKTTENSSIGVGGWTPLVDKERNLLVVVGMQNLVRPFQPYYPGMKQVLRGIVPAASLTPGGIASAASYEAGPVAPGELLSLFGRGLGPAQAVAGSGTTVLGGTRVLFDGTPARLLYTSAGQVVAVAPAEIAGKTSVETQVEVDGARLAPVTVAVAAAWPALFTADSTGVGQGAAVNPDGSSNGPSSPAARGATIRLFGTGACTEAGTSGISATIRGESASVLACGPAEGLAPGVFQLTLGVPATAAPGAAAVSVRAGAYTSLPGVTISIQ